MDIRDYYQKTATASIYAAWITLFLAMLFFVLHVSHVMRGNVIIMTAPFIFLSILNFVGSRVYANRLTSLPEKLVDTNMQLLKVNELAVTFLPAPTLRMLLFNKSGNMLGEIRDRNMRWFMWMIPNSLTLLLPKNYQLYNGSGDIVAQYKLKAGFGKTMKILNSQGELIAIYHQDMKKSLFKMRGLIKKPDGEAWIPIETDTYLTSFEIKSVKNRKIASYQKGWLPMEWGQMFKNPNTPIITFYDVAEEDERIAVLGVYAAIFHHRTN